MHIQDIYLCHEVKHRNHLHPHTYSDQFTRKWNQYNPNTPILFHFPVASNQLYTNSISNNVRLHTTQNALHTAKGPVIINCAGEGDHLVLIKYDN